MARQLRVLPPGFPVHVVHRGVNRTTCFDNEPDYLLYLDLLREHSRSAGCAIHAYVLMSTHLHLLLTAGEPDGVSRLMKSVAQRYTQDMNRARGRSGPLWEGRFKSSVVTDDAYLLACYRYIEMNPVRARLVAAAVDYPWSSHRANAGLEYSTLVKRHPVYIGLATHDEACAAAYRTLFDVPLHSNRCDEIRVALNRGLPLGGREYRARFAAAWRTRRQAAQSTEGEAAQRRTGV